VSRVQSEQRTESIKRPLPEGWLWTKLGEVCEQDKKIVEPNSLSAKSLPYLSLENVQSGTGRILKGVAGREDANGKSTTFVFDERHVLYGKLRPYLNKVALPDFRGRCTTEMIPLLPKERIDREFLGWLLRRSETVGAAMRQKTGSRMPRADMDDLFTLEVPLPPLPEQKRIAALLTEQMAAVDRARAAAEVQLEAAKALTAAYLRDVFNGPEAQKWPRRRLGEVCEIIGGNTLPRCEESREEERVYCLKVSDLEGRYSDGYRLSGGALCTTRQHVGNRLLKPGAVVFPKRGGAIATNKKRILQVYAVLDPNLMGVQMRDEALVLPAFLHLWFQSWDISSLQSGNTVPQINQQDLAPLSVGLPPMHEQQRITACLGEQMTSLERMYRMLETQLATINALPAALLRQAFSGEL